MEEVKSFFDQNRKFAREAEGTNQSVQGVRIAIDKLKDDISDIWESFFSESARFKTVSFHSKRKRKRKRKIHKTLLTSDRTPKIYLKIYRIMRRKWIHLL
jgi:hypothetical protein